MATKFVKPNNKWTFRRNLREYLFCAFPLEKEPRPQYIYHFVLSIDAPREPSFSFQSENRFLWFMVAVTLSFEQHDICLHLFLIRESLFGNWIDNLADKSICINQAAYPIIHLYVFLSFFLILAFQRIVYGFLLFLLKSVALFFDDPYIALKFQYPSKTQTRFFFASANYVWWTGCWVAQSSGLGALRN